MSCCLPNIFTLRHVDSLNLELLPEKDGLNECRNLIKNWIEIMVMQYFEKFFI